VGVLTLPGLAGLHSVPGAGLACAQRVERMMSDEVKAAAAAIANSKTTKCKTTRPAQLQKLLSRNSGATIAQIQLAFGWQPHTARAAISTQRKTGCLIERSTTNRGSVYRIVRTAETQ